MLPNSRVIAAFGEGRAMPPLFLKGYYAYVGVNFRLESRFSFEKGITMRSESFAILHRYRPY